VHELVGRNHTSGFQQQCSEDGPLPLSAKGERTIIHDDLEGSEETELEGHGPLLPPFLLARRSLAVR
jgi:hypothetical protein